MITAQQPESPNDGFDNLIDTTIPVNITCNSSIHNSSAPGVECISAEEILNLLASPCNRSLLVVIMDVNRTVVLNRTLHSSPELQQIQYEVMGDERQFNFSVEVVTDTEDSMNYYILSLVGSSIGLEFPLTAIPVDCRPSSPSGIIIKHAASQN